jgi:outer membrane receptor protein involved in Fe transport
LRHVKSAAFPALNLHFVYIFIPAAALAAALAGVPATSERIVVSAVASRVEQTLDATPATVSVIEREDLERTLSRDIREALRYEPGVSVENGAARFGVGNIAIRGLDGNRVQMLQDGVRLPDGFRVGSFSNASRNPFDVALLSTIEMLRGPGSALYGSDALAGVVSMTTIDPREVLRAGERMGGFADVAHASADESLHRTGAFAAPTARSARAGARRKVRAPRARWRIPRTRAPTRSSRRSCCPPPTAGAGASRGTHTNGASRPTCCRSIPSRRAR